MRLDNHLPEFDFVERHRTRVAAPPDRAIAAARALTMRDVPLFLLLMAIRDLPQLFVPGGRRVSLDEPVRDQFVEAGFAVLTDGEDELVMGGVGRFWRLDGGVRPVTAAEFTAFDEPGYAKVALNTTVEPLGDGTLLRTQTRIHCTDEAARRAFGRYWRLVGPGSDVIRRALLRAARRRAERPG
jgi:hypothetical protein